MLASRIWSACEEIATGPSVAGLMQRARVLVRAARALHRLRTWHSWPVDSAMADLARRHPLAPILRDAPYVNAQWSRERREQVRRSHYDLVHGPLGCLRMPIDGARTVAHLDDLHPGLTFVLDRPYWFRHEGELALSIYLGDTRLYSLVFTLADTDGGMRTAYVGALQGRAAEDSLDTYRALTRACHGLRPRDLLVAAFRSLCLALAVMRILAVSDRGSARRSDYFHDRRDIHFSYDAAWCELGGREAGDEGYELDVVPPRRALADMPSNKRAMYRRRYEMLDTLAQRMAAGLGGIAPPSDSPAPSGVAGPDALVAAAAA